MSDKANILEKSTQSDLISMISKVRVAVAGADALLNEMGESFYASAGDGLVELVEDLLRKLESIIPEQ